MTNLSLKDIQNFLEPRLKDFYQEVLRLVNSSGNQKALTAPTTSQAVVVRDTNLAVTPAQAVIPFDANSNQAISQLLTELKTLREENQSLTQRLIALETRVENMKDTQPVPTVYDLKREFDVFIKSTIVLDYKSAVITGQALNRFFAKILPKKKEAKGFKDYEFSERAVLFDLTTREWLVPRVTQTCYPGTTELIDISKFKVGKSGSLVVDNSFNPFDLDQESKPVTVGTGGGKSSHLAREIAFAGRSVAELEADPAIPRGLTLAVPEPSLKSSVLAAHEWLSSGKDLKRENGKLVPDEEQRVTKCILCFKNHTAQFNEKGEPVMYEVIAKDENGKEILGANGKPVKIKKQLGKYETVLYEFGKPTPPSLINVMTYDELLYVYDMSISKKPEERAKSLDTEGNPIIKPWVAIDEFHIDTPSFERTCHHFMEKAKADNVIRAKIKKGEKTVKTPELPFKVLGMSATLGTHPTSIKLSGQTHDLCVTDFVEFQKEQAGVFTKRTTLVFCDDLSQLNDEKDPKTKKPDPLRPLKEIGIKTDELFDALNPMATELVGQIIRGPNIVITRTPHAVGYSFGNVNVIDTCISLRRVIKGIVKKDGVTKFDEVTIFGDSDFTEIAQKRGRTNREVSFDGYYMAIKDKPGNWKGKITWKDDKGKTQPDYGGKVVDEYFKNPSEANRTELHKFLDIFRKPQPMEELDPEVGKINFNRILWFTLVNDLDKKLQPTQLFNTHLTADKKAQRKPGEYIFKNPLTKYAQEADIEQIMLKFVEEKIDDLVQAGFESKSINYAWVGTEDLEDDYRFIDDPEVKTFGGFFKMRTAKSKTGEIGFKYEFLINKDQEKYGIKFTFYPYMLNQAKKDFLSGKTDQYEAKVEVPAK